MDDTEVCVVAPTGTLGYGFNVADFHRALDEHGADVIAIDAGSTDPGPYYLGSGESFTNELEIKDELGILIEAGLQHDIPVIVGSCGGAGAAPHLQWVVDIVSKLAEERSWSFRLATISADVSCELVEQHRVRGDTAPLDHDNPLTSEDVIGASRIVAQMGYEPIVEALRQGADVILAGRSCDDALMAAYPIFRGCDPALALHMGKLLECGAIASEPAGMDVLVGRLGDDYFDLVPGSPHRACTPMSVSSHSLYEREDPLLQRGPGGVLDLSGVAVEALTNRVARVRGARYEHTTDYFVKLEGVRHVGFRSIAIAGVRCPALVSRIGPVLDDVRRHVEDYFASLGQPEATSAMHVHVYGRDAVMDGLETVRDSASHELGLVIEAVAPTATLAKTVCHRFAGTLLHIDFPGQYNNAGNLAFLYSPAELDAGEVFEFSVYHLMKVDTALELFPITLAAFVDGKVTTDEPIQTA
jgi:hypothetical protein